MAKREALRELQNRLAERLQAAMTEVPSASWLAVQCAGVGLMFPLRTAGEIFTAAGVLPVPHTQAWFLGVANLRGALTGVVDLAGFLGLRDRVPASVRDQARLVAFNPALELNVALLVDRLAGLRNLEQLTAEPPGEQSQPAFVGGRFRDAAGRVWQELRLAILAHDERFLRIAGGE